METFNDNMFTAGLSRNGIDLASVVAGNIDKNTINQFSTTLVSNIHNLDFANLEYILNADTVVKYCFIAHLVTLLDAAVVRQFRSSPNFDTNSINALDIKFIIDLVDSARFFARNVSFHIRQLNPLSDLICNKLEHSIEQLSKISLHYK
jgi:hypothetical protein